MLNNNKILNIRTTTIDDVHTILSFIHEIATYEKLEDQVITTVETLQKSLFEHKQAEVFLMEYAKENIGFIIVYEHFSSFVGKSGLYLEDIYINPTYRNRGFGKKALGFVADLAVQRDVHRIEWSVLNWNEPSIAFYKSIGAQAMDEWTTYRLDKEAIEKVALLK